MELLNRIINLLLSSNILFSTALCVVVPMIFYWISDRMQKYDPVWKQELTEERMQEASMRPVGSSNNNEMQK